MERTICAPWGLHGGKDALANRVTVFHKSGTVEKFPTGKIKPTEISAGEGFLIETAGGGGFWDPLSAIPSACLPTCARLRVAGSGATAGVAIVKVGRRYALDTAATAELRAEICITNSECKFHTGE
jgi:N-methylhydantoinase B